MSGYHTGRAFPMRRIHVAASESQQIEGEWKEVLDEAILFPFGAK